MKARHRAPVLVRIASMTEDQHASVKKLAIDKVIDWSTTQGEYGGLITKFREEVKEHYFRSQRRRCCYCSIELHDHKITYDAEHILDKAEYPEYMFEPGNLAASCRLCNQSKSNRPISASGLRFSELSRNKDDYSIVHPHLDEWQDHLTFDLIGRIAPVNDSTKGSGTIQLCGILALNAARLSDEFSLDDQKKAETALRKFHEVGDLGRKREILELLSAMALRYDHPGSKAVMSALREDVEQSELAQQKAVALAANRILDDVSRRPAPRPRMTLRWNAALLAPPAEPAAPEAREQTPDE